MTQYTSQILDVITPQVRQQVALALSQQSVSTAQKNQLTSQVIAALEPTVSSAVSAKLQAEKQAALSSVKVSAFETSKKYAGKIVAVLQPQIEAAVFSALRAQYQSQVNMMMTLGNVVFTFSISLLDREQLQLQLHPDFGVRGLQRVDSHHHDPHP